MARLERQIFPIQLSRIAVRFEGAGSQKFPQPKEEDLDENTRVITVCFVESDGNGGRKRTDPVEEGHRP